MTDQNKSHQEKWSPGPWQVVQITNPADIFLIQDGNAIDVCKFNPFNRDKFNAARIVACVNYLSGIPSDKLFGKLLDSDYGKNLL